MSLYQLRAQAGLPSDIDILGRDSGPCLLRKPVTEGVVAEEGHDANFAVETL